MSELDDSKRNLATIRVRPMKAILLLTLAAPPVFLAAFLMSSPLAPDLRFQAIYGRFLDLYLHKVLFALFLWASLAGVYSLRSFIVSSEEILTWRLIAPRRTRRINMSEVGEVSLPKLPGFLNPAHKSFKIKLKDGSKLSIPYDYENSFAAFEFIRNHANSIMRPHG